MKVTVEEMKAYLRVDGEEENTMIDGLLQAAELYLLNAGCTLESINESANNLAKLAIKLLVSHWYENRDIEKVGKTITKVSFSLESIITQLKYCYGSEAQ